MYSVAVERCDAPRAMSEIDNGIDLHKITTISRRRAEEESPNRIQLELADPGGAAVVLRGFNCSDL